MVHQPIASDSDAVISTAVRVAALDGYLLGATHFGRPGSANPPTVVLFSCGGGIPAARYARFARYLAANDVPVLVYDYRGIGASRPSQLRGFGAFAEDWSELDCGGAIAYLRYRYPTAELVGMSHSIGTLLTVGAPNVGEISRFVFLCAHTGYVGDYLPRYRIPMAILWHGVMPILTRVLGYFPARILGLGEDIPAGVALQWAARISRDLRPESTDPDAARARVMISRYQKVNGDVLTVGFSDDAFATKAGTQRLLDALPGLRTTTLSIIPSQVGMSKIGHFGFFRRSAETLLWPLVLRYLQNQTTFVPPVADRTT